MTLESPHHSFSIELAKEYSVEEAILIHHFQHWLLVNARLNQNFHEGRYWTYQTLDWMAAHFTYFSRDQVFRIIQKLVQKEILIKGNFNEDKRDRTVWYALKDQEFLKPNMHIAKSQNANCETAKCIYKEQILEHTDTKETPVSKDTVPLSEKRQKIKEEKIEVAKEVWLTPKQKKSFEEEKLKGNIPFAESCYKTLSEWKIGKEITGGNDYKCLISWVIRATEEKCQTNQKIKSRTGFINSKRNELDKDLPERPLPPPGLIMEMLKG